VREADAVSENGTGSTTRHVEVDMLIVGAGPAGLYGAYYVGERGLTVAVVDSLSEVGGQVTAMYPEKQIYDVAGFPTVSGRDLVRGLTAQAAQHEPTYLLGQEAQQLVQLDDGRFKVTTSRAEVTAGAVILTGGIGTFTPRKLPAGEDFLGRGLEYFVPSSQEYVGRDVVIVGGGDSAIDWALMLEPLAATVTLVHRRDQFRAHGASVDKVRALDVTMITNAQVTALEGDPLLERAIVTVRGEEQPRVVPCDRVVAALGFTANLGPLREWGLELRDNRHVVVDTAMRTNIPGVFAAGDITDYDGKVRLISVGFGEVATAVNNAAVHLDPTAHVFPGHTSNEPHDVPVPA
jgi:thioredoxin reductase (NADPH)